MTVIAPGKEETAVQSQEFDFSYVPPPTPTPTSTGHAGQDEQSYLSSQEAHWPIVICLLGGFRVLKAGKPVAVHSKKSRTLLGALAAAPDHRVPREALLE